MTATVHDLDAKRQPDSPYCTCPQPQPEPIGWGDARQCADCRKKVEG